MSYTCAHCHRTLDDHEPAKVYSEGTRYWFFCQNGDCFPRWKIRRMQNEIDLLRRHIGEEDRLANGG